MNLIFETERLLLRPLELSDAEAMFAMDNNPIVHKYLWQQPTQTIEETIKIIEYVQRQYAENKIGRFATILKDYDVVLHSNKDAKVLEKSLGILKQGGTLVSLTGPPTGEFAKKIGLGWHLQMIMNLLSMSARRKAKKLNVNFKFLFMRADGKALSEITKLIEGEKIRPIVDKVFPFEQTNEAMSYVESGRAKGKVVVKVK